MKSCHIPDWKRVSDAEAKVRLEAYRKLKGSGPFSPSALADVIWPNHKMKAQGAAGAATRVLKRLGCYFSGGRNSWGWIISFK